MSDESTTETEAEAVETSALDEALAAAFELVKEDKAPPLTLIHEPADKASPIVVEGLTDPGDAAAWLREQLQGGALDADAPERAVIWVPGDAEVIADYLPLFVLLRELGYAQSFEFEPLTEWVEDFVAVMAPLTDLGAQFSNDDQAAFLAPSSEAPATARQALDASDPETPEPTTVHEDDGTRSLVLILLGSLVLIGTLAGGFAYLASQHSKNTEAANETTKREAQRAYDEGVKAQKRRNYALAEQHLRRCIELDPFRVGAVAELGALLSEDMKRHEEALKLYEKVLAGPAGKQPIATTLHFNRGNVLLRLGRYAEAVDAYDLALEVVPIRARLNKVEALIQLGQTAEARKTLEPFLLTRRPTFGGKPVQPGLQPRILNYKQRLGLR